MASDESVSMLDLEDDCDIDDGYHHPHPHYPHPQHHQPHPHNLSRLSMCSSSNSTMYGHDDGGVGDANYFHADDGDNSDDGGHHSIRMFLSRLSIESFHGDGDGDGDADEEFSDEKEGKEISGGFSSDSDKEPLVCYSLPATPPRRRNRSGGFNQQQQQQQQQLKGLLVKEYASENEVQDFLLHRQKMRKNTIMRRRRRRIIRERWLERANAMGDHSVSGYSKKTVNTEEVDEEDMAINMDMDMGGWGGGSGSGSGGGNNYGYHSNSNWGNNSHSGGESEGGGGGGLVVITRPKGGKRSLCMDLEEVKACRDLGFELEHEHAIEIMPPTRLSVSVAGSPLDTSSGGNSPIANWRISSPGDDPRDVKARLKVWAQAVALASTSRHGC